MAVHYLIKHKTEYMAKEDLYYRACNPAIYFTIRNRPKAQGSFRRKKVNCGNCKRTDIFLEE